ncbi:DUF951 domain-containing protein, partial [Dysosmobacter welbionis]
DIPPARQRIQPVLHRAAVRHAPAGGRLYPGVHHTPGEPGLPGDDPAGSGRCRCHQPVAGRKHAL